VYDIVIGKILVLAHEKLYSKFHPKAVAGYLPNSLSDVKFNGY
jgi:hypothetical protein